MARKNCILLSYIGSQVCNCEISVTLNGPSLKTNAANIKITTMLCAKGLKSTLEKMDYVYFLISTSAIEILLLLYT